MRRRLGWLLVLAIAISPGAAKAEERQQESWKFFKLDFTVRELEGGKTVNMRNYTMMTKAGDLQQLRVGTRIPITVEENKIQYTDVGLSVDCRILEGPGGRALDTKAEITSFASPDGEKGTPTGTPLMRHVQMNALAPITLGKSVVISGVDELTSNHRFQLEVTATELK